MPPSASCPSGMISRIMTITIGAANAMGRFITRLTSLPQKPFSTSARVLVFCVLSASQVSQSSHRLPVAEERHPQQGAHAERVDVGAEDGQRGGQHGDRQDRRQHDRGDDRVGDRLEEALREQQQRHRRRHQDHRGEHDGPARGHHRPTHRGLGVVALGDLLAEPAHHEQAVVDRDAEAHQGHHRLGEEVHRDELGDQAHDAERARDGQAADDPRERGRDHAAEHEEQHHAHQRDGRHLGTPLVLADGAGQLAGQWLQAGQLDVDAVDVSASLTVLPSSPRFLL